MKIWMDEWKDKTCEVETSIDSMCIFLFVQLFFKSNEARECDAAFARHPYPSVPDK